MAKAGKRRTEEGTTTTSSSGRVTPPKATQAEQSARYTAKGTSSTKAGPSPQWVPLLMFGLWIVGLLLIILNYMGVLPGAEDGNGWYLVTGLVAMLGGIMVATQYR
ncbi:MAG: cell division protein CrgA [Microthrixaceae bacterium]